MMKNYKMLLQYDGTRYNGWQKQGSTQMTIQGKLETILSRLAGHAVEVHGSGRTDSGVHARGQVANAKLSTSLTPEQLCEYLNMYLPNDIAVLSVSVAPMGFHSRLHAVSKTYRYQIRTAPSLDVFTRAYVYHYGRTLDVEAMKQAAAFLIGEHDFKAFCSLKKMKKSSVRRLDSIEFEQSAAEIAIVFTGSGFLYHMVRILVGTLIEVGEGKRSPESVRQMLLAGKRELAGALVPPEGLTLLEVCYNRVTE